MTKRSRAREVALQLLFQYDYNPKVARAELERFVRDRLKHPPSQWFCLRNFDGVLKHLKEIDRRLGEAAENWRLPRMSGVDRNVLRLGAHEVLYVPDTPPSVALNEAIELARRFGSAESPAFVNGVLDKLLKTRDQSPLDTEEEGLETGDSAEKGLATRDSGLGNSDTKPQPNP